ncbi:cupin domain-containing protein [Mesorhizobium sp. CAU 1732]|uniref:cupin domain-containing protein n=1 Tax=Mesorhizobium sp. CAU 1732 TaxID=3140358 RepID=UPI003260A107
MNLWKGALAIVAALAIGGVAVTGAIAQTVNAWTPKPVAAAPYKAPHKPRTTIADVRAKIAPPNQSKTWRVPVVEDKHLRAAWHQLAVFDSTPTLRVADHQTAFIVWEGQIEVTIQGVEPFVATKGFMVRVPYRRAFSMKNVGTVPSLHFEIFNADATILYEESSATLPKPPSRMNWYLSRLDAPDSLTRQPQPIFYDFLASPAAGAFVSDDRMFVNRIRGQARNCDPQPATSIGHFHADYAEFWFIMEGQISYNIEGVPFFVSEPGDIVYVPAGRWHSAANHCPGFDTRIAINGYPGGSHHWPVNNQPPTPPISGKGYLD